MPAADHDPSARLTDLEIKAAYAEDALEQLSMTIYRQQQQIDALVRQIEALHQQRAADPGAAVRSLRDELPPHY